MSATYRVSAKALIFNNHGEVLLVKEHYNDWNLPGGGIDYGESPRQAVERELQEEINLSLSISSEPIKTVNFYHEVLDRWVMWVVFKVNIEEADNICPGADVRDVRFASAEELGDGCEERIVADLLMSGST